MPECARFIPAPSGPVAIRAHVGNAPDKILIIVPPPFEERKGTQRLLVGLGRRLEAAHTLVVRIDPFGTGDSAGALTDVDGRTWGSDMDAVASWLESQFPCLPQFWLGVRLSALHVLSLASTAQRPPAGLVLWEPVADGRTFVRQLVQRRLVNDMLAYGQARASRRQVEETLAAGGTVDLDGFPLTARLHAGLLALRPQPWPGPALVASTGPDARGAEACEAGMPSAERLTLRLPPFWNTVGQIDASELIDRTANWMASQSTATPPAEVSELSVLSDSAQAGEGRESLVTFPGGAGLLRGVLHAPPTSVPPRGCWLLLPGWSGDRTGPHRLFVHAARRLAAQGHTCLRIDYGGRGDSDDVPGGATIASMTADARAALQWLASKHPGNGPLGLIAICSGCKVAIGTAAVEPGVRRLVLWSAEAMGSLRAHATDRRKRAASLLAYARKLTRRETWLKLLTGRVRAGMVGQALMQNREVRSPEEARAEDRTLAAFRAFRGRVLFVFGGSDPDAPGSSRAYDAFCRTHAIPHTCHTVPHAGHSYYGLDWEAQLLDVSFREI